MASPVFNLLGQNLRENLNGLIIEISYSGIIKVNIWGHLGGIYYILFVPDMTQPKVEGNDTDLLSWADAEERLAGHVKEELTPLMCKSHT